MKRHFSTYLLLILLLSVAPRAFAWQQAEVVDTLFARLQKFNTKCPQEKVYLHTDANQYVTGESVWLKAYLLDGASHQLLDVSKVLYVELLSERNELVVKQKLKVDEGLTYSDIYLPHNMSSGHYTLRAYTLWMSNFSEDFYFSKTIEIFNTKDPWITLNRDKTINTSFDLQFFPEGGELIANVENKVAFKAVNTRGQGMSMQGVILDDNGNRIGSFSTSHNGMGSFLITPEARQLYFAVVETEEFGQIKIPLPQARKDGIAVQVDPFAGENIYLQITGSPQYKNQDLYLLVQSRGNIAYAATGRFSKSRMETRIPQNRLPHGINQLTWFNNEGIPLAERLIYIDRPAITRTRLTGIPERTTPREKVKMQLVVENEQGLGQNGSYSIAVRQLFDQGSKLETSSIRDYLDLRSELKGTIEDPGHYFDGSPEATAHLDLLLMTQGWRRFDWKAIAAGHIPELRFPFEQNLRVKGRIKGKGISPSDSLKVDIYFLNQKEVYEGNVDEAGRFDIPVVDFYGRDSLVLHIMDGRTPAKSFELSFPGPPKANGLLKRKFLGVSDALREHGEQMTMQEEFLANYSYYLPERRDLTMADPYLNPMVRIPGRAYHEGAEYSFDMNEYVLLDDMRETFRELITGVKVTGKREETRFYIYDKGSNQYFEELPLIVSDGIPHYEQSVILKLRPEHVAEIQVLEEFRHTGIFGAMGRYGVLIIKTRDNRITPGDLNSTQFMPFEGFYAAREYYTPVYESEASREVRIPDFRHLLYWNPLLETDDFGQASIDFYTSDITGEFEVHLEGITLTGEPVTIVQRFINGLPEE